MPYTTEEYIHLPNPEHPESEFRLNNKGQVNIVGTINFGAGVKGRLGLLRGNGKSAVYVYLFKKTKYDKNSAKEWLKNHGSDKTMNNNLLTNKKFKFNLPVTKSYTGDDGFLYLEYALATTDVDLEKEQVTPKFLESMAEQAPHINMYLEHSYTEENTLGPVVSSEIKGNQLWVKGRVRKSKEEKVNDLLKSGTHMGGSFGGICHKDYVEDGIRKLDEGLLLDATFTPMPVNQATLGTASMEYKGCTVCNQIIKSIERKYDLDISDKIIEPEIVENKSIKNSKEDINMEVEEIKELLDANKASILDEVKELIKPLKQTPTVDEVGKEVDKAKVEVEEFDREAFVKDITDGVLKSLGIEPDEEPEEEPAKLVVMDAKTLEERDEELVQKALKSIAKNREGEPKSKRLGGPKFINAEKEKKDMDETRDVGKVSTRKAAEMLVQRKGL